MMDCSIMRGGWWRNAIVSAMLTTTAAQGEWKLTSPDGHVAATAAIDARGRVTYAVERDGVAVILASPIGVIVDGVDLGAGVTADSNPETYRVDETYPWRGVKSEAVNRCNGLRIGLTHKRSGTAWTLDVRAYDDGVAYRCVVSGSGTHRVTGEAAAWRLPEGSRIWFQDQTRNYEGYYAAYVIRPPLPARPESIGMPVTVELPTGGFACLSEADTMHYSGMSLTLGEDGALQSAFQDDPDGWTMDGAFATPWRIVIAAADLNGLVNSDIVHDVCPPPDPKLFPAGIHTDWIKPGRCLWQWWAYDFPGTKWELQKGFVDKAAALHCQYYLVDEGWENPEHGWFGPENDPWIRMKELCDYARGQGVGIWVWRGWTAWPERHWPGLETRAKREAFFAKCAEVGVVGTKIDFMDSESHERLAFYHDCLRIAAEHKIMVNFHGANKPAGESRTWPHEMTREGVRGLEHNKWSALPPAHYATLPFVRFVVGPGDFTPTTFQKEFQRGTTAAAQLADAVVFTSPILCWADKPDVYLASPAVELIRAMPCVWDETRVLPGSQIGVLAAFARRVGDEWWVGVINGTQQNVQYALDLGFLSAGSYAATTVADVPKESDQMSVEHRAVTAGDSFTIVLEQAGGFVARVVKK
jgi:alpha-glucosidase